MSTKIQSRLLQIESQQNAILSRSGENLTDADQAAYNALDNEARNLRDIQRELTPVMPRQTTPDALGGTVYATPKKHKLQCFSDEKKARQFGLFVLGSVLGNQAAKLLAEKEGLKINAAGMREGDNIKGGYFVPEEMSSDMIRLVEDRGVFRRESRVVTLKHETLNIPRRTNGTTAYFIGEADQITSSDMSIDLVKLVLKKAGVIVPVSYELASDAILPVFDAIAKEIAYAIADKEDECGFNGDGTSTYGGMTGIRQALVDSALGGVEGGAAPATAGLVRYDTGHAFTNIGLGDLNNMIGRLPTYAEAGAKWYGSKILWSYLLDLMADAGKNAIFDIQRGPTGRGFMGYEYVVTDVMPKDTAASRVVLLLGDLKLASTMAVDGALRLEQSNSATIGGVNLFETDQAAIRGISRFDINIHDTGSTTTAGPVIGLIAHTA